MISHFSTPNFRGAAVSDIFLQCVEANLPSDSKHLDAFALIAVSAKQAKVLFRRRSAKGKWNLVIVFQRMVGSAHLALSVRASPNFTFERTTRSSRLTIRNLFVSIGRRDV